MTDRAYFQHVKNQRSQILSELEILIIFVSLYQQFLLHNSFVTLEAEAELPTSHRD